MVLEVVLEVLEVLLEVLEVVLEVLEVVGGRRSKPSSLPPPLQVATLPKPVWRVWQAPIETGAYSPNTDCPDKLLLANTDQLKAYKELTRSL